MRRTATISALALLGLLASTGLAAQATTSAAKPAASQQPAMKPAAKPTTTAMAAKPATQAAAKPAHELVNLNTATREQLVALPGIGETYADAIIKARPFASKSELVSKKVISEAAYKKVRSMVIAKHTA